MPMHESLDPIKVTLIVEVDGHRFAFEEVARRVAGARYHGEDPRESGYSTGDTLESSIREAVAVCFDRAEVRSRETLKRLYPIAGDR